MPEVMQGRSRAFGAVWKICDDLGMIHSPKFFFQVSKTLYLAQLAVMCQIYFAVSKTRQGALDHHRKVESEGHKTPCHPVLMQISSKKYARSLFVVSRTAQDADVIMQ